MPLPEEEHYRDPHRVLLWVAEALVAVYVIGNAVAIPLFRPVRRVLARLHLAMCLEAMFVHLPPYAVLALLLVPFLSAEPAKVYALYLMGTGHFALGLATFVGAYFVSLVLVDQIYHAGKAKLRSLPWFAKLVDWLFAFRDQFVAWAKSTPAWHIARHFETKFRETVSRWRLRWASWFTSLRA